MKPHSPLSIVALGIVAVLICWILLDLSGPSGPPLPSTGNKQSESVQDQLEASNPGGNGRISTSHAQARDEGVVTNWWEDPESLDRFLAEYQRQLPGAFADQMGHRSPPAETRTRLAVNLEKVIRGAKEGLLFNEIEADEFDGLVYDSLRSGTSWLSEQTHRYIEWQRDEKRGKGSLPSLEQMRGEIRYFPPEMILSRIVGKPVWELTWSKEDVSKVSSARNSFLREVALIEAHLWEVAPAATRAADALGFETGLAVDFGKIIPEWRAFNEMIDAEVDRYLFELDLIGTGVGR